MMALTTFVLSGSVYTFATMLLEQLWRATWQGGLALVVAWIICRYVRGISPSMRAWCWRIAYAKLLITLCLPLAWPAHLAPNIRLPKMPALAAHVPTASPVDLMLAGQRVTLEPTSSTPTTIAMPSTVGAPMTSPPPMPPTRSFWQRFSASFQYDWPLWMLAFWVLGVLIGLGVLVRGWRLARQIRRAARPIDREGLAALVAHIGAQVGVRRLPIVLEHDTIGPLLLGTLPATIILPAQVAREADEEALRLMLTHEMVHLRHRDIPWGWMVILAEVVFFFHPLVWLTRREWRMMQEMACDERVLRHAEGAAKQYSTLLIDVAANRLGQRTPVPMGLGVSETFQALERRLLALMDCRRYSRRMMMVAGTGLTILALLILMPWRLGAAPPTDEATPSVTPLRAPLTQTYILTDEDGRVRIVTVQMTNLVRKIAWSKEAPHGPFEFMRADAPFTDARLQLFDHVARTGDVAFARELLRNSPGLARASNRYGTLAKVAAQETEGNGMPYTHAEYPRMLSLLIEHGADPNQVDPDTGLTPLHAAVMNHQVGNAERLLRQGANPNRTIIDGITPLYQVTSAVMDPRIAALLRQFGGKYIVNAPTLHTAVAEGNAEAVRQLIVSVPRQVDSTDRHGRTPLGLAITCGRTEIARMLLEGGADANKSFTGTLDVGPDTDGAWYGYEGEMGAQRSPYRLPTATMHASNRLTPLDAAVRQGAPDLVNLVLHHGARVVSSKYPFTLLFWRIAHSGTIEQREQQYAILDQLLSCRVTASQPAQLHGDAPSMYGRLLCDAARIPTKDIVRATRMLINAGAQVNYQYFDENDQVLGRTATVQVDHEYRSLSWRTSLPLVPITCLRHFVQQTGVVDADSAYGQVPSKTDMRPREINDMLTVVRMLIDHGADVQALTDLDIIMAPVSLQTILLHAGYRQKEPWRDYLQGAPEISHYRIPPDWK